MSMPVYDVWLAATGLSALKRNKLRTACGSAEAVFNVSAETLRQTSGLREKDIDKLIENRDRSKRLAAKAVRYMKDNGIACLTQDDPDFPEMLKHIYNPPAALFVRGDVSLLRNEAKLAMVGSRKASASGIKTARTFGKVFSEAGVTVVSGLAEGIDAASAEGALGGIGSTIAVLGTGLDICYPAINRPLYDAIGEKGLLISEFFFGVSARRFNFPLRNRLISGLSDGVLVVEAAAKSGALITASHAAEQGKEVYAVPQDIHAISGAGANQLLKDGAKVVTAPEDVLEDFAVYLPKKRKKVESTTKEQTTKEQAALPADLSDAELTLIKTIKGGVTTVDDLVVKTGQPIAALNATLMMLELKGVIAVSFGEITMLV